jgi:hypothetical protein
MNRSRTDLHKTHATTTGWLPLDLPAAPARRVHRRPRTFRPCGRERAAWWFDQMRQIVDSGGDFRA